MVKLIIFFRKPVDDAVIEAFEEHFSFRHVPLVDAMPGVVRTSVSRAIGAPRGEAPYHLIHDVYFADMAALNFALNSAEGRAAGADLSTFARDIASLMFAEVWGEDPFEMGLVGAEPVPADEVEPAIEAPVVPIATVAAVATSEVIDSAETVQPEAVAVVEASATALPEVADPAPRDIMAELEKDLAAYRKVPIDVSFLEKPREQPTPEPVAVVEAQLPVANSELSDASPTDTPIPDPRHPPQPSSEETRA